MWARILLSTVMMTAAAPACALREVPVGRWEITEGDTGLPYIRKGAWLRVGPGPTAGEAEVWWDNGLTCSSALGTRRRGRIDVPIWDTPASIVLTGRSSARLEFTGLQPPSSVRLKRVSTTWMQFCE